MRASLVSREVITDEDGAIIRPSDAEAMAREEIARLTAADAIDFYTDLFSASLPADGIEGVKKKLPEFLRSKVAKVGTATVAPASE